MIHFEFSQKIPENCTILLNVLAPRAVGKPFRLTDSQFRLWRNFLEFQVFRSLIRLSLKRLCKWPWAPWNRCKHRDRIAVPNRFMTSLKISKEISGLRCNRRLLKATTRHLRGWGLNLSSCCWVKADQGVGWGVYNDTAASMCTTESEQDLGGRSGEGCFALLEP